MAHSWSVAGNKVTLTLDGTETGVIQRERVFNFPGHDGEQITFYFSVNPSVVAVEAFLQVVGGDLTLATLTGAHTLVARGEIDGSDNVTVRFGVQEAGEAPGTLFFTQRLDFASDAEAVAAGWTVVKESGGSISYDATDTDGNAHTPKFTVHDDGNAYYTRTFTTVVGRHYILSGRGRQDANRGFDTGCRLEWEPGSDAHFQTNTYVEKSVGRTGTGSDTIMVGRRGGYFGIPGTYWAKISTVTVDDGTTGAGATVEFDELTYCFGSGVGDGGTGLGGDPEDPGTDPIPDPPPGGWEPPPVGGTRPFGNWALPAAGNVGYWNSTVKAATVNNVEDLLNDALGGNMKLMLTWAITQEVVVNGVFSYDRWNTLFTACYTNTRIRNRILAAQNSEGWCHMLIDEPNRSNRWGGEIPFATVEKMAVRSKQLFPDWRVVVRTSPTHDWWRRANRHMNGVDSLWAEYLLARGPVQQFFADNLALCSSYEHTLVTGIHYGDFDRPNTGNYITVAQLDYYGKYIADLTSPLIVAMSGWKWRQAMWDQPGFPAKLKEVRDLFASHD